MTIDRLAETHAEVSDTEVQYATASVPDRSTTKAKTGAYSWRFGSNDDYCGLGFAAKPGLRTGFHINHNLLSGDVDLAMFHETLTANYSVQLRWMEDELRWDLLINDAIQDQISASDIGFLNSDQWFHIGLIADNAAGFASVYLDGTKVLTYSGAITGADWDLVAYGRGRQTNAFLNYAYYDNMYVDSIASESDVVPPAYEFLPSYPDGADTADWTAEPVVANYLNVDDGAVDDGDTTYNRVSTSAGALEDRHETADIALPDDYIIVAAHPYVVAKKLNAADDAQIEPSVHDGVVGDYGDSLALPTSYAYLRNRMEDQPDASAWNLIDFNAMLFGYRASGSF